ncbi:MAG: hypothetical protein IJU71_08650, partial [Selenomonadaceae bacterium]|nr:hypothetical protein [Selenomonadaceae bacterium]
MSELNNRSSASVVSGTSSADSIKNSGSYATIDAGDDNDTIINSSEIRVGLRNDSGLIDYEGIAFSGLYSSISGGEGDDVIVDLVGRSTINGGTGNDTVTLGAYSVFEYAAGDGNDVIFNYTPDNPIRITDGKLKSTLGSGSNLVLTIGDGKITLKGARYTALNLVDADSEVPSSPAKSFDKRILGTEDNDTLYTQNPGVSVRGGSGNDLIINDSNIADNAMLYGGDDDDSIVSNSRGVLIDGGKGDDAIELSGLDQTIVFRGSDGNDTVVGYQSTDTVHIVDGSSYSTQQSGDNIILKVGDGSITFKNASDQVLTIDDTSIDDEIPEPEWTIAELGMSGIEYSKKKG